MRVIPFLIPLLLFAVPAMAQSWQRNCSSTSTTTAVTGDSFVCFDPTANTDDTPILSASCDYTNWSYYEDKDGDSTDCTVAYTVQTCPDRTLGASAADAGCEDVEVPGGVADLSSTSRHQAGIAVGPYLRAEAGGAGANAGDCRLIVTCSDGGQ